MPAALVPRLAVLDELPTRTSGKVDRDALPWPLPTRHEPAAALAGTSARIAEIWAEVLGAEVTSPADEFFDAGGGSLSAAQVVSRLRETHPEVTVGDIYSQPTVAALAAHLEGCAMGTTVTRSGIGHGAPRCAAAASSPSCSRWCACGHWPRCAGSPGS